MPHLFLLGGWIRGYTLMLQPHHATSAAVLHLLCLGLHYPGKRWTFLLTNGPGPRCTSSPVHGHLFKGNHSADKAEHLNTGLSSSVLDQGDVLKTETHMSLSLDQPHALESSLLKPKGCSNLLKSLFEDCLFF